jgi:hypothetical protein
MYYISIVKCPSVQNRELQQRIKPGLILLWKRLAPARARSRLFWFQAEEIPGLG